jgi:antirestriction protein ArdC
MDLYQTITDRIIGQLEQGVAPWICPWKAKGGNVPHNAVTGRQYSGINLLLLMASPYASNAWLTYKQAQAAGGYVKKGERGTPIIFWQFSIREDRDTGEQKQSALMRQYTVFNSEQCEDLNLKVHASDPLSPTEIDQAIAATRANINYGGNRACYIPSHDKILMPERGAFRTIENYHTTLLHELTHWTSHKDRCDRQLGKRFGDQAYAAEELIAEIGSAFLCARLGVPVEGLQHADYIGNWLKVLQGDKRAIFTASKKAQLAVDWICNAAGIGETVQDEDQAIAA